MNSLVVSPSSASLELPATQQFEATGHYSDGSSKDLTQSVAWNSSNPAVARLDAAGADPGLVTMVGSGTADIEASLGTRATLARVTITSPVKISVSPPFASVTVTHQTQAFSAAVQGATNTAVIWSVDGVAGGNPTLGTVSGAGVYTPPPTGGIHVIAATSPADLGKTASAQIAVMDNPGVFTRNNDNARLSRNTDEIVLTPQNVNARTFGKLFSYRVDGRVYAQPLYAANVKLRDGSYHNIVYAATANDTVYAWDADHPATGVIWQKSLVDAAAGETPVPCGDESGACILIGPEIGILGTPVIDPATDTLYVAAFSRLNGSYYHKLHALDLASGAEKFGGPVALQSTVAGTALDGDGASVPFVPYDLLQRPALLLSNGMVYVAFASYNDHPPYHGWVLAYNARTLQPAAAYNTTSNGSEGGIWQGGGGPAADASGNIYIMTGNGTFDANTGGGDYGDSFIKLSPLLNVLDYFTPYNQATLNSKDMDLGSGGPLLLPDQSAPAPHLLIGGGKVGVVYLLDRDNLGHYNSVRDSLNVQTLSGAAGNIFSNPAYWNGHIYYEGANAGLAMFNLQNSVLPNGAASQGSYVSGFPGATPSVSADQTRHGIVWTLDTNSDPTQPAVLRAYDATDVSVELYASDQASGGRDTAGKTMKFQVPTVVNGKVFAATAGELDVYGLLPH